MTSDKQGAAYTVGQYSYTSSNPIMVSYAVIGASRGIGLEYVRQLVSRSLVQRVVSFANV